MKNLAWTFVFTVGFLFVIPILAYLWWGYRYSPIEYATFVGSTAGPLAALAGFLFVYINFKQQQEQITKHDQQFERQSFENGFFHLLESHRLIQYYFVENAQSFMTARENFKDEVQKAWKRFNNPPIKLEDVPKSIVEAIYKDTSRLNGGQHLIKSITVLLLYMILPNLLTKENTLKYCSTGWP